MRLPLPRTDCPRRFPGRPGMPRHVRDLGGPPLGATWLDRHDRGDDVSRSIPGPQTRSADTVARAASGGTQLGDAQKTDQKGGEQQQGGSENARPARSSTPHRLGWIAVPSELGGQELRLVVDPIDLPGSATEHRHDVVSPASAGTAGIRNGERSGRRPPSRGRVAPYRRASNRRSASRLDAPMSWGRMVIGGSWDLIRRMGQSGTRSARQASRSDGYPGRAAAIEQDAHRCPRPATSST